MLKAKNIEEVRWFGHEKLQKSKSDTALNL